MSRSTKPSYDKSILTSIGKKDKIQSLLTQLLNKNELDYLEMEYLYSVVMILIKEYEKQCKNDRKSNLFIEFAYYIIGKVAFITKDFSALYDFSVNYGYYPIARKIIDLNLLEDISVNHFISNIAMDRYKNEKNIILTYEQKNVFNEILKSKSVSKAFIAPTSYGKSEMIFKHISLNDEKKSIGIIVPTKALIDQVFRDAKKYKINRKIIIHDQNYNVEKDERILAIVTQERGLRILEAGAVFDIIYIDEAHEIMDFNFLYFQSNRSLLLARFIRIASSKNPNLLKLYLSPVIQDVENFNIKGLQDNISNYKINKDLKILEIMFLDVENQSYSYNRFLNHFTPLNNFRSKWDYINENKKNKNLHFLYRPIYIESYAEKLYENLKHDEFKIPPEIEEIIYELKNAIHPKFKLAKYLSKGIIYLHGSVPEIIKNYILKTFREVQFINHFIANSVILGGMNLPIDNLFYIAGSASLRDLKNLIGRVNRLNEIFSHKNRDLSRIFIPVHFLEMNEYPQLNGGLIKNKIEILRDSIHDEVKNPVLKTAVIKRGNIESANKIVRDEINVIESFDAPNFNSKLLRAGAQQILKYTAEGLKLLEQRLDTYKLQNNINPLEAINEVFFKDFEVKKHFDPLPNAKRLSYLNTIRYYTRFINSLNSKTIYDRVEEEIEFWKMKAAKNYSYKTFVGSSFGEEPFETNSLSQGPKLYVNINKYLHNEEHLCNLAIMKLKVDEDYVKYEITLLLNTLLEFHIITQDEFDYFIFGTKNEKELNILRLGITRSMYRKLKEDDMIKNIIYDQYGNPEANKDLELYIKAQKGIAKFELEQYFMR